MPAPRSPELLPEARERARIPDDHARAHAADIDAEFQGVRRDHAADGPVAQAALDGPPFKGQVAAPVTGHALRFAGLVPERVAQVGEQQFHANAARSEDDRLYPRPDKPPGNVAGGLERRLPDAQFAVHHRRVVHHHDALALGSAVVVHHLDLIAHERGGQFARVADGRRTEDERGV